MYKKMLMTLAVLFSAASLYAQTDTVWISDRYTTHFVYGTDINYADLSDPASLAATIVAESKNKLAVKAKKPFTSTASLAVEETDGSFHTCILAYRSEPESFFIDRRAGHMPVPISVVDTVWISELYTTHFIFATDISYADISRTSDIAGRLVEQGRNKLAIKATRPFNGTMNLSVEESNGMWHSFILAYRRNPENFVTDTRSTKYGGRTLATSASSNRYRKLDAPQLSDIIAKPRHLYHIAQSKYKLKVACENVFSYSDVTYIVLSLKNKSAIGYACEDAVFEIVSGKDGKKKLVNRALLQPKNRFGNLATPSRSISRIAYSFDKMTLSEGQEVRVYIYETDGSRNLLLTLTAADINGAVSPQ